MEPGIYHGLAFEDYLKVKAISKSALIQLRKTPRHLREYLQTGAAKATPALQLGSVAHTLILEPDQFRRRYAVGPDRPRNTKDWRQFEETVREGQEAIKQAEFADASSMAASLDFRPEIESILRARGPVESSLFWEDVEHGYACKARPDKLVPELGLLADLKTTDSLDDRDLQRKIVTYGYHLQGRFYLDGLDELYRMGKIGERYERFVIVWIESKPPYELRATEFDLFGAWMDLARLELDELRRGYARCLSSGLWPGYPDKIELAPPPPNWLLNEMGEDLDLTIGGETIAA